ncbi:MAG: lipoyl(octanoyl) transferase LipB [Gammaproteobacteria bacterium]|nr:lipoyl(octanoyl) transferase LipB [Gammaproteobacteria bacterium]
MSTKHGLRVRRLGRTGYRPTWEAMRTFTDGRGPETPDELWLTEHPPVFTLGQAGKPEHLLDPGAIPVIRVDRGGQVTYHGPGQVMAYLLLDLKRRGLGVRELVERLEQAVIDLLAAHGIEAHGRRDAPGVYVGGAKIAALGLRIRHGRSYHGLSLNVAMDLEPFGRINPCGHPGLEVTQLSALGGPAELERVADELAAHLARVLGVDGTEAV